ncbi:MAG: hypothetical protein AB2L09_09125 [Coriobacteriia bacterium]
MDRDALAELDRQQPGIAHKVLTLEAAPLPVCPSCGSADTAAVECGVASSALCLAVATTKFRLVTEGPLPGAHYCNDCRQYFD